MSLKLSSSSYPQNKHGSLYANKVFFFSRDLKMHNIMLTGNSKKLKLIGNILFFEAFSLTLPFWKLVTFFSSFIDFGLSNFFNKEHLLKTHCGSAEYAAPELFEKGATYGASVEIWSM